MELEKIKIKRHIPDGEEFQVLFNPNTYRVTDSNQFVEVAVPGLRSPLIQFGRGNMRTLSMQFFFDSYEEKKDVRIYTRKITNLLETERELHAPPVCLLSWGGPTFVGVLEQVNTNFTLFLPTGVPVRANHGCHLQRVPGNGQSCAVGQAELRPFREAIRRQASGYAEQYRRGVSW